MLRTFARIGVAGAVVLSALLTASPATAGPGDGSCEWGESCVFKHVNYGGGMADMHPTDADWRNNHYSSGGSAHDSASSGFGHDRAVRYFQHINFGGHHFTLGVGVYDAVWGANQPLATSSSFNFNDQVSSSVLLTYPG